MRFSKRFEMIDHNMQSQNGPNADPLYDCQNQFGCKLYTPSVRQSLERISYVIPSYQRKFRWGIKESSRLLSDIYSYYVAAVNRYSDDYKKIERNQPEANMEAKQRIAQKSYIESNPNNKFVGTLILVKDKTVSQKISKTDALYSVIDGQQRLSTFS